MKRSESKYFHTAAKMDEAFLAILEKKDFAYITVKEVCAKAGVHRSTFYLHYETTRDLLEEAMEYIGSRFQEYFPTDMAEMRRKIREGGREELMFLTPGYLAPYLAFIKDHKRLFAAALQRPEAFCAEGAYQRLFADVFQPAMEQFHIPEAEREYILHFYIGGIIGLIREWLERDCAEPVDTVVEIIMKCVFPR